MIDGSRFIFWEYLEEYGIFNEYGDLIGFRDDAPEEVKKSWEEYQKICDEMRSRGIKA